jgi:acetate kinase
LSEPTAHARTARQFLYYKLPEAIGTAIAALGDLDALVFTSSNLTQAMPFIEKICSGLELLHIQYDSTQENIRNGMHKLSSEASSIQVFGLQYDRWNILAEAVRLAQAPDATN